MAMLRTGRPLPGHRSGPATVAAGHYGKTPTPGPTTKLPMLGRAIEESTSTGTGTMVTDVDRAGVSFGETALIDESFRLRSAKITAETEVHCLMFPKWGFRQFAMSHPQTAWALLEVMAQRVRDADDR